jgi:hypothetical protein
MNDLRDILMEKQAESNAAAMVLDFSLVRDIDFTGLAVCRTLCLRLATSPVNRASRTFATTWRPMVSRCWRPT